MVDGMLDRGRVWYVQGDSQERFRAEFFRGSRWFWRRPAQCFAVSAVSSDSEDPRPDAETNEAKWVLGLSIPITRC